MDSLIHANNNNKFHKSPLANLGKGNKFSNLYNMDEKARIFENKEYKKPIQLDEVLKSYNNMAEEKKLQEKRIS